jgi:hypothetical protein
MRPCECVYNHGTYPDGTCQGCGFTAPPNDARPLAPVRAPVVAPRPSVPPGYYDEHEAGRFAIQRGGQKR